MRSQLRIYLIGMLLLNAPAAIAGSRPSEVASESTSISALAPPQVRGYLQVRETLSSRVGAAATLNRARVGVEGPLPASFSYKLQLEAQSHVAGSSTAAVSMRDAWIQWTRSTLALTAGQMDTPFSREWVMKIPDLETPDRSIVTETLAPRGDIGVMALWSPDSSFSLAAGAFNGEGQNATANRDSTTLFIARAAVQPRAGCFLGTSLAMSGTDSTRYAVEAGVQYGRFSTRGEFLAQRHRGVDSRDEGWYALLLVRTLPWLRLVGRQEELHRPLVPPERARERGTTIGLLADHPGGHVRGMLDYVRRTVGFGSQPAGALIAQLQARFF